MKRFFAYIHFQDGARHIKDARRPLAQIGSLKLKIELGVLLVNTFIFIPPFPATTKKGGNVILVYVSFKFRGLENFHSIILKALLSFCC